MTFPVRLPRAAPLLEGVLVRRHKRFLADIDLADGGGRITAHCVNTGAMEGLTRPGTRVWVSRATNPARKLAFTWELAELADGLYGVNTAEPNRLVRGLLERRLLPWLGRWTELVPERPYGERSRVDFWMRLARGREAYVEVKNCHLLYPDGRAYFPDTVSERAAKHMEELEALAGRPGVACHVLFACQTPPLKAVRPSDAHDPGFAEAARQAHAAGVRFSAIALRQTPAETVVTGRVPVDMRPYRPERMTRWKQQNRALRHEPLEPPAS